MRTKTTTKILLALCFMGLLAGLFGCQKSRIANRDTVQFSIIPAPFTTDCYQRDSIIVSNLPSDPQEQILYYAKVTHEQSLMTVTDNFDIFNFYSNPELLTPLQWCDGFDNLAFSVQCGGFSARQISHCVNLGLNPDRQGTITWADSFVSHTMTVVGLPNKLVVIGTMYGVYFTDEYGTLMDLREMIKDLAINGGDRIRVNQLDVTGSYIQTDPDPCCVCEYDCDRVEYITEIDTINELYLARAKRDGAFFIETWGNEYETLIYNRTSLMRPLNDLQDIKWLLWAKPEIYGVIDEPDLQFYLDSMTSEIPYDLETLNNNQWNN